MSRTNARMRRMREMAAASDDVARLAGVSTATVPRALRGVGGVNARTRERVRAAVREPGYFSGEAVRQRADASAAAIANQASSVVAQNTFSGFYTFFAGMPKEFEEAAAIDGAGPWRTLFSVILPNAKPVFASVAILSFLTSWGMYLWPVMMIGKPSVTPLPLEIGAFQGQSVVNWGQVFAFGVLMVAPVVLVFLLFQRWFVRSVASTAIKG